MSKILTPFERHLKEKLEDHEMPYEHSAWLAMQKSLGAGKAASYAWMVALVATVAVIGGGSAFIYHQRSSSAHANRGVEQARFAEHVAISPALSVYDELPIAGITGMTDELGNMAQDAAISGSSISSTNTSSANGYSNENQLAATSGGNNQLNTSGIENQGYSGASGKAGSVQNQGSASSTSGWNQGAGDAKSTTHADNIVGVSSNIRQACAGVEIDFAVNNSPKDGSRFLWNFGDGHFSDSQNPKHKFSKAGTYDVSLSVTSNNGQINTTVMNDMITIEPAPQADFIWEFVNEDPMKPQVRLINESSDATKYEWIFTDGSVSNGQDAMLNLNNHGKQMVVLNTENNQGCSDGAVKYISVNTDFNLEAQQSIRAGKDFFMPRGLKTSKVNFEMSIYDQSGNLVYTTSSRLKGWDAKLSDGSYAPVGSKYTWKVIITNDISKEQKYFNGTFTVSP